MKVAQLDITLLEPMSFATTQANKLVTTAPLIHPYALGFALGWAGRDGSKPNPYMTGQDLDRRSDTGGADHRGMLCKMPFRLSAATALNQRHVTRTLQRGQEGFRTAPEKIRDNPAGDHVIANWHPDLAFPTKGKNLFQYGKSREIDTGSVLRAYAWGDIEGFPRYIRLGRWMSKAIVNWTVVDHQQGSGSWQSELTLLPEDTPRGTEDFDLINMSPCSLIRHPTGEGRYLKAGREIIPLNP